METTIRAELQRIEDEHDITIIYACESGSRAWGFPSEDSDYDVRFIYAHRMPWYLSVMKRRDVIEYPPGPVLDINGWDIPKALGLLRKSNIGLLEWLASPIVYLRRADLLAFLEELISVGFSKHTSAHNYLAMAKSNMDKIYQDKVTLKRYLYSIRPILCCRWVLDRDQPAPTDFGIVAEAYLSGTSVGNEVAELIERKKGMRESESATRNETLDHFLNEEYARLRGLVSEKSTLPPADPFDSAFHQILETLEKKSR